MVDRRGFVGGAVASVAFAASAAPVLALAARDDLRVHAQALARVHRAHLTTLQMAATRDFTAPTLSSFDAKRRVTNAVLAEFHARALKACEASAAAARPLTRHALDRSISNLYAACTAGHSLSHPYAGYAAA